MIGTEFWDENADLGPDSLYVLLYLRTCPATHLAGMYRIPLWILSGHCKLSGERVTAALVELSTRPRPADGLLRLHWDRAADIVWLPDMTLALTRSPKIAKAVASHVAQMRTSLVGAFSATYDRVSKGYGEGYPHLPIPTPNTIQDLVSEPDVRAREIPGPGLLPAHQQDQQQGPEEIAQDGPDPGGAADVGGLASGGVARAAAAFLGLLRARTGIDHELNPVVMAGVEAALAAGYTDRDLRLVVWHRSVEWGQGSKMRDNLRPSVLLSARLSEYVVMARAAFKARELAWATASGAAPALVAAGFTRKCPCGAISSRDDGSCEICTLARQMVGVEGTGDEF